MDTQKEIMNVAEMTDSSEISQIKIHRRKREKRIPFSQKYNFQQHPENQLFAGWKNLYIDTQKEVMGVAELELFLCISQEKIRQLIREKRIPYIRLDGRILFLRSEIIKWLLSKQIAVNDVDLSEKLSKDIMNRFRKVS